MASSSTMTATTTRVLSNQERQQQAFARIKAIHTRPTTLAAQEFFSSGKNTDWKSLPRRLRRLCEVLEHWVRNNQWMGDLVWFS
jgi:hypothetical protein